ncbi:hypothetical protein H4683_004086 [Filibacter limicola]|uniref:Uncharacterized protein n=1 Tax=Sporosarcina limicola TaxID=34101 RepID=A0A927MMB5_9BACL|nr:hypothetical protein [Sporosarcina limicola]
MWRVILPPLGKIFSTWYLGAIRYMHDMSPNVKHNLSDNKGLKDTFSILLEKHPQ